MTARIRVSNLSLDVPVYLQRDRQGGGWGSILMGAAFDPPRRRMTRLLDGIDLDLREGDRLAILGRNGAGKSTLLRVLNRVYQPSAGSLEVSGSCQALLNMGLGFNNEATVRENIYLRGVAMGLKSGFLQTQVESILEFSGLGEKTSHRLHTLSSGQKMRLGFAISTCVQHDIILMDEWVGAGDAEFMARARERMQDRVGGSKIIVLASHSVGLLRDICNRGIVLERGKLVFRGDIIDALKAYHETLANFRAGVVPTTADAGDAHAHGALTYGCVEQISVKEGTIHLQGWCVNSDGTIPAGLVMLAGGLRHAASRIESYARPDVVRHLGLSDDKCGFRARFDVAGIASLTDVGVEFQVLGGESAEVAHAPLRIAATVASAIGGTSPGRPSIDRT